MENTLSLSINELVQQVNGHYRQLLNLNHRRTKLSILPREEWIKFCERYNYNKETEGIFLPRNLTAYLCEDSDNLAMNLFHEYFGHGLFFEYAEHARFLRKLENRLKKEENRFFRARDFTIKELEDFRDKNASYRLIKKDEELNKNLYEAFAIWTELYLSNIFGIQGKFNQKYKEIDKGIENDLEHLLNYQQKHGELALFYKIGMPKYYNSKKIKNFLKNTNSTKLVLLYGSRKPYSDIDLFVVSPDINNSTNKLIDIHNLTLKQFEYAISVFDVAITDSILTGELISGDEHYLNHIKRQLAEQPITQEAIYYNLIRAKQQKILASEYSENSRARKVGNLYFKTYSKNAIKLSQGKRILTKKLLLEC